MIEVFYGVEMFVRDPLFIRKCTQSIVIVKTCLVELLLAIRLVMKNATSQNNSKHSLVTSKENGL